MQVGHLPSTIVVLERKVGYLGPQPVCRIHCSCAFCVVQDPEHTRDQALAADLSCNTGWSYLRTWLQWLVTYLHSIHTQMVGYVMEDCNAQRTQVEWAEVS